MSLENTLLNADITDLQILRGLLQRDPLDKIAEETHYSLSTVKYRIRKMCERYGTSDKNILLNSLQAYVSPEKLLTAEERVL
jgi:DNA-binding Lrp family transcriptional regulator